MRERFMDEWRAIHLGAPFAGSSVNAELQAAFEAEAAKSGLS